jgi:hypothetical protein
MAVNVFPIAGGGAAGFTNVAIFTASGTFVHPDASAGNPKPVKVFVMGAGGGGAAGRKSGNQDGFNGQGGTGGGSGFVEQLDTSVEGAVVVTVGSGGAGGVAVSSPGTNVNGSNGGATSFGSITAYGGGGGIVENNNYIRGGVGGSVGGGIKAAAGFSQWAGYQGFGGGSFGSNAPIDQTAAFDSDNFRFFTSSNTEDTHPIRGYTPATDIQFKQGNVNPDATRQYFFYRPSSIDRLISGGGGGGACTSNTDANSGGSFGTGGTGFLGGGGSGGRATFITSTTLVMGNTVLAGSNATGYGGGGGGGGALKVNTSIGSAFTMNFPGSGGSGTGGYVMVWY